MTISFPTLDLGELGAQIDAAVLADDGDVVELDAAPVEAADGAEVEDGESAGGEVAAADAAPAETPDADAAYRARFEAEYAERSKEDLSKLRSSLDKARSKVEREFRSASDERDEARDYAEFLERQLAEYDPEVVGRFRANRQRVQVQRQGDRQRREQSAELKAAYRRQEFPKLFPGVDPEDPEILAAFEAGDWPLERALIRLRQAEVASATRPAPATPAPAAADPPAAAPARDAQGRFLPAEQTRQLEKLRGNDGLTQPRGGGLPDKQPTTVLEARRVFQAKMGRLIRSA